MQNCHATFFLVETILIKVRVNLTKKNWKQPTIFLNKSNIVFETNISLIQFGSISIYEKKNISDILSKMTWINNFNYNRNFSLNFSVPIAFIINGKHFSFTFHT